MSKGTKKSMKKKDPGPEACRNSIKSTGIHLKNQDTIKLKKIKNFQGLIPEKNTKNINQIDMEEALKIKTATNMILIAEKEVTAVTIKKNKNFIVLVIVMTDMTDKRKIMILKNHIHLLLTVLQIDNNQIQRTGERMQDIINIKLEKSLTENIN